MTKYDTSAQAAGWKERRRINLIAGTVLLALGLYFIASYVYLAYSPDPPTSTFGFLLGLFVAILAFLPLSQAFSRRRHPASVEIRDDALVLRYPDLPPRRLAWEDRPVEFAYDARGVQGRKALPEGMQAQLYLPVPGRQPGSTAFRPEEVHISGQALDEVKARMEAAHFRVVARPWSRGRPGKLVEFLSPGEEELPPMPEAHSRLFGGRPPEPGA